MAHTLQRLFPLCILAFLLVGCSFGSNGTTSTLADGRATPTQQLPNANTDTCPAALGGVSGCFTPHEMRLAYGVEGLINKGLTGKGQTVIDIVSFGSPTLQQDMQVFDKTFGLPAVNLQIISPLNEAEYDPHHDKAGWAQETDLDVQIIHAIAPDARIIVLTSPVAETEGTVGLPEFRQLEQYVLDHKLGNIVSQSWGASELTLTDQQGQQELQKWNTLFQTGTTQDGMTYFSSSGDNGAADYLDASQTRYGRTTSFAPDSPWVTSVGGTTIQRTGITFEETAWNSSGGGFSRILRRTVLSENLAGQ